MRFRASQYDEVVEARCRAWEGTKYSFNRRRRQVAVDCVHFVSGVLDELFGIEASRSLQSLLPDACVHDRKTVLVMLRLWLIAYPHERVRDGSVEAGDVLFFRPTLAKSTVSHVAIAGSEGKLWHATPPRVCFTGLGALPNLSHLATYRSPCKSSWIPPRSS